MKSQLFHRSRTSVLFLQNRGDGESTGAVRREQAGECGTERGRLFLIIVVPSPVTGAVSSVLTGVTPVWSFS